MNAIITPVELLIKQHRYTAELRELGYTDDDLRLINLFVPSESYENDPDYELLKRTPKVWPVTFSSKVCNEIKELEIAYGRMKWIMSSIDDAERENRRRLDDALMLDELSNKEQRRIEGNRKNASQPRIPRVDPLMQERIIGMGRRLATTQAPHEITGTILAQITDAPSTKTIRRILRDAGIIPPA